MQSTHRLNSLVTLGWALTFLVITSGCNNDATCKVDTSYDPVINPGAFATSVDNPLNPLVPGTEFVYLEGANSNFVTVLPQTKVILGVSCTTVHDVVKHGNQITEDTYDWIAQDTTGAVWYFGEDTKELSNVRWSARKVPGSRG